MEWLKKLLGLAAPDAPANLDEAAQAALAAWRKLPDPDLNQPHLRSRYVVVDVETSGLDMRRDHLISIGAVALNNGLIDPQDSFQIVLRQDSASSHANILIHGIGGSEQRQGVEPAEALLGFLAYAGKAPLVAFHAQFDQTMIDRALREHLGATLKLCWIDLAWVLPELFRDRMNGQGVLDDWLQLFGITNFLRHNAVADSYATAQLLQIAIAQGAGTAKESPQAFLDAEKARRWLHRAA